MAIDGVSAARSRRFDNIVVMGMGGSGIVGDVVQSRRQRHAARSRRRAEVVPDARRSSVRARSSSRSRTPAAPRRRCRDDARRVRRRRARSSRSRAAARSRDRHRARGVCASRARPASRCRASRSAAMVAPRVRRASSAWALCPRRTPTLVKAQEQLARRRDAVQAGRRRREEPGARAGAQDRPHDPAHPRRRRARRGRRDALEAVHEREREGTRVLELRYPSSNHNEICGWGQHGDVTRQVLTLVLARHGLRARAARAAQMIIHARWSRRRSCRCSRWRPQGEGRLAQLLDLMYLGTWMSGYLALDNDVDPGPIDAIAQLKAALRRLTGSSRLPRLRRR